LLFYRGNPCDIDYPERKRKGINKPVGV